MTSTPRRNGPNINITSPSSLFGRGGGGGGPGGGGVGSPPPSHTPGRYSSTTSSSRRSNNNNNNSSRSRSVSPIEDNEEVRALAAKLAPALEQADALFSTIPDEFRRLSSEAAAAAAAADRIGENNNAGNDDDDADSIDEEVQALVLSEQLLRQELDMANDFSNFFRSPGRNFIDDEDDVEDTDDEDTDDDDDYYYEQQQQQQQQQLVALNTSVERASGTTTTSTSAAEADIQPVDEQHEEDALDSKKSYSEQEENMEVKEPVDINNKNSHSTPVNISRQSPTTTPLDPIRIPSQNKNTATTTTPQQNPVKSTPGSNIPPRQTPKTPDLTQLLFVSPATAARQLPPGELQPQQQQQSSPQSYTTNDHATHIGLRLEHSTWYSLDLSRNLKLITINNSNDDDAGGYYDNSTHCHEYCLTLPESKLKHLCLGLQEVHPQTTQQQQQQQQQQHLSLQPPPGPPPQPPPALPGTTEEAEGTITATVVVDESHNNATTASPSSSSSPAIKMRRSQPDAPPSSSSSSPPLVRRSSPSKLTSKGTPGSSSSSKQRRQHQIQQQQLPLLPVRTVSVRIRPDVLCGAVMDAVQHSLLENFLDHYEDDTTEELLNNNNAESMDVRILKRQGGHLQAVIEPRPPQQPPEAPVSANTSDDGDTASTSGSAAAAAAATPASLPGAAAATTSVAFFLDAQLCTYKSAHCERILLIRVYHHGDSSSNSTAAAASTTASPSTPAAATPSAEASVSPTTLTTSDSGDSFHIVSNLDPGRDRAVAALSSANHLREACALIQRMESPQTAKRIRISSSSATNSLGSPSGTPASKVQTMSDVRQAVSHHLLTHFKACPSVRDGGLTLPSLNSNDWCVVQSCWSTISAIYQELESRDLSYSSLRGSRFGSFPALPTLDVHYCSQLRQLSRQDMIVHLLKSASELEEYARKAEYACANMISLLQPTFETYGIDAPSLPKATPLTSYPLDFVAPQQACPPWGRAVLEALNEIQAWAGTVVDDPLGMLRLGDPDEGASTERNSQAAQESLDMANKSVQLVVKAFQRQYDEEKGARLGRKNCQVMDRLAKMQQHEHLTILALDRSFQHSDKALKAAQEFESNSDGIFQVPLLKWSIVVGGSTGTCWVTSNHILFVTQLIPVIGSSKVTIFPLQDVEFRVVQEGTASLLNPLPTVISVVQNETQVYSFRPSMGGGRLKSFLEIVQQTNLEDPVDFITAADSASTV